MKEVLKIENVCKAYGKFKVLEQASFNIYENEIFGLLGPNGAGKSTLAKIASGLLKADSGTVEILGERVEFFFKSFNKHIGVVPQEISCYYEFTVKQNFFFFGRLYEIPHEKLIERIDFLINWLGLKFFENRKVQHLSGGYKRLVNIGLTLIHDPKIIFLDEPTVGLDPKIRSMFWERIKELKQQGKSIILTTHYMDEAEVLCDRVAIMDKGQILIEGNPKELARQYGGDVILTLNLDKEFSRTLLNVLQSTVGFADSQILGNQLIISFMKGLSLDKVNKITNFVTKNNFEIKASHVREPELEDVFINFTGKKLRDYEKTA